MITTIAPGEAPPAVQPLHHPEAVRPMIIGTGTVRVLLRAADLLPLTRVVLLPAPLQLLLAVHLEMVAEAAVLPVRVDRTIAEEVVAEPEVINPTWHNTEI